MTLGTWNGSDIGPPDAAPEASQPSYELTGRSH